MASLLVLREGLAKEEWTLLFRKDGDVAVDTVLDENFAEKIPVGEVCLKTVHWLENRVNWHRLAYL